MTYRNESRHVIDEDRRELLTALGVAGSVAVGGATLDAVRDEVTGSAATAELASVGQAIKSDLGGQLEAGALASQQADLSAAATELSAVLERGVPEQAPRDEFTAVAGAVRPMYERFDDVEFFESTTAHLPAFEPEFLNNAIGTFVGSNALSGSLDGFDFVGGQSIDVLATVIGNAQQLNDHWVSSEEITRHDLEYGEYVPPMTKAATGGALLWLEDLDQHLWQNSVLLTDDILADAVWHGQALASGLHLVAEGAKAIAAEDAALSDAELTSLLGTGFAVQAISQELLPSNAYWITEEMRGERRTDLERATR